MNQGSDIYTEEKSCVSHLPLTTYHLSLTTYLTFTLRLVNQKDIEMKNKKDIRFSTNVHPSVTLNWVIDNE